MTGRELATRTARASTPDLRAGLAVIMAGGTGGHVFPALAVAQCLRDAGLRVLWIGNRKGMEAQLVPAHGYEMAWISFSGLRGKGLITKLMLPLNLLVAFSQALAILVRVKPQVVLGFGGYITFPGGMMAVLLGRPLLLHEQNAVAGLANRTLARVANRVLCAFPDAIAGAAWSGNPVREEIAGLSAPELRYAGRSGPLRLLVVGGSLGARALNDVIPEALALLPTQVRPRVLHQAGAQQLDALKANYARAGVKADVLGFIDDMAGALADADLLVCRAGAMTVAEVACAGVAAIFVPYPFAVDDHQTANAQFLAASGAALLLQQRDMRAEGLAAMIAELTRERCLGIATKARALAKPDAAAVVARACIELAQPR